MRLFALNDNVLINPEHISHISREVRPAPENGGQYAHEYPVFVFTMFDGAKYEVPFKNSYPQEGYPFADLSYILSTMGATFLPGR